MTQQPTPDELRLAREICARLVEADSLAKLGEMFRAGRLDSDTRIAPAIAAIRATSELAANYVRTWKGKPTPESELDCLGYDIRSGDHLKGPAA